MRMKICIKCKVAKEATDKLYYRLPSGRLRGMCRNCESVKYKDWYITNKERHLLTSRKWQKKNPKKVTLYLRKYRETHPKQYFQYALKGRYGLSLDEYWKMSKLQGGKCAICQNGENSNKSKKLLSVDHCHKTNKVRGLLCDRCNLGLGLLGDSSEIIAKALKYMRKYARNIS